MTVVPAQHRGLSNHRHLSIVLWQLGFPDQAVEQMEEVLERSESLSHPYTLVATYIWSAWLHQYRRESPRVQAQAEKAIALSLQYEFAYWLEHGSILLGWALAQQGQIEEGMTQMHKSLAKREIIDAHLHQPIFLASLAELYGQIGQPQQGLCLLDEALDQVDASRERWPEADIYRLQGELLRIQGADAGEVESHLLQALAVARQQEAKSLELRAAMSLSRLWQQHGQSHEAYALLAGIYGWFSEGFDTADLIEAKALLEELS